jgi:hypothetical protein
VQVDPASRACHLHLHVTIVFFFAKTFHQELEFSTFLPSWKLAKSEIYRPPNIIYNAVAISFNADLNIHH